MPFPTITPNSLSLVSVNPTRITTTLNGIDQRQSSTGQYFRLTAQFDNLEQANQRLIFNHIHSVSGPLTSFTFALPSYLGNSTGGYSGTVTVTASAAIGASTVSITAGPVLKAGDLIKFASHDKLYVVAADITSASTSLTFTPPLRTAVTSTSLITHRSLSISVRYATDNQEFSMGADQFPSFSIEFIEVLT